MKKLLAILLLLPCLSYGQPSPTYPASQTQVNDGLVGAPFYVTPLTLASFTFISTNLALSTYTNNLLNTSNGAIAVATNAVIGYFGSVTNLIAFTNAFPTKGKALVIVGTNAAGMVLVAPTNWPAGGGTGTLLPPNALGVLTNDGNGNTNWGDLFPLEWISTNGGMNAQIPTVGTDGMLHYSNSVAGGGSSLPTAAYDGQVYYSQAGGTIVTNFGSPVGYFTNGNVVMLFEGDSLTTGQGDIHDYGYYLTNSYLPSNWIYGTNAGVVGKTVATMAGEMAAFLAPWGLSGTTNKVALVWGGINDIVGNKTAAVTASNLNYCLFLAKQSNCVTVTFTITSDSELYGFEREALRDYNNRVMAGTNWDYLVQLHVAFPPPPNDGFYADSVHYASYDPVAFQVNQALQRGRKNLYTPFRNTSGTFVSGSAATPGTGFQASLLGSGTTPTLQLGRTANFGMMLFPSSTGVDWYYNSADFAFGAASQIKLSITTTNTYFPNGIYSGTNTAGITPITPTGTGGASFTNNIGTRAVLCVPYYIQDALTGTPIGTFSNRVTGKKLTISMGSLGIISTNFCNLPPCSPGDVWDIRNESTGSGVTFGYPSVGPAADWYPVN